MIKHWRICVRRAIVTHLTSSECLTPFQENPLASVFEESVYEHFHLSPKPKQSIQQLHPPPNNSSVEIDVRRCRRSGLDNNIEPIPIFSPLDEIQECSNCNLGDYNFIDKGLEILDIGKYTKYYPYTGPRWYWKGATKYMLEIGVIRWDDIKLTLTATAHLPHDFFRNMFTTLEETQSNVRTDWDTVPKRDFAKEP